MSERRTLRSGAHLIDDDDDLPEVSQIIRRARAKSITAKDEKVHIKQEPGVKQEPKIKQEPGVKQEVVIKEEDVDSEEF